MRNSTRDLLRGLASFALGSLADRRSERRKREEDLAALSQLAAAQRADQASTAAFVAALAGVALAYVAATLYYKGPLAEGLSGWLVLVPMPIWLVVNVASLATTATRHRMATLRVLEAHILDASGLPQESGVRASWSAADDIMDFQRAAWYARTVIALSLTGVAVLLVIYTWFFIYSSGAPIAIQVTAYVGYGAASVAVLLLLASGDRRIRRSR